MQEMIRYEFRGYAAANNRTLSESDYHAWSRHWGLLRAASEIQVLGTSNNVLSPLFREFATWVSGAL